MILVDKNLTALDFKLINFLSAGTGPIEASAAKLHLVPNSQRDNMSTPVLPESSVTNEVPPVPTSDSVVLISAYPYPFLG